MNREEIISLLQELNEEAIDIDKYCFGLPLYDSYLELMIFIVDNYVNKKANDN